MTEKLPLGVNHAKNGRFRAIITVNRKQCHLGVYDDIPTAERTVIQARKMIDDLELRSPKRVVHVPSIRYIEIPKPSTWSLFLKKIGWLK